MIDTETIKKAYQSLSDAQLQKLEREESHQLTPEAAQLLKDELKSRKIEFSNSSFLMYKQEFRLHKAKGR